MEYVLGALGLLFFPLWLGSMLLAAFWEKDNEGVKTQEKREQGQQSQRPIREVEKQPSVAPGVVDSEVNEGGGHSTANQQTGKTHHADERRMRKKRRR